MSPEAQRRTCAITLKSADRLFRAFSPARWDYAIANAEKAYRADVMTLSECNKTYGDDTGKTWMRIQVKALLVASSSKDADLIHSVNVFADTFAEDACVRNMKMSELLLFFARYKTGRYDNSFAFFDVRRIGYAFYHEFLKERQQELSAIEYHDSQKRIADMMEEAKKTSVTREEYLQIKERAKAGEADALSLLRRV